MGAVSKTYDLFLSHRGPDRKDFCAFLREALHRAGVDAFVDEFDLQKGVPETAWTTMQDALRSARCAMPVISQGYCESQWCLDELAIMMQTPANVMPVFFDVNPNKNTLVDLLKRGRLRDSSPDKLEAWTIAIEKVITKTGWRGELFADGYVPQLVRDIVKVVLERLGRPALHVAEQPVDVDRRVMDIKKCLADRAASSAAVVGLHGMGGIGKTTLAKAVFNAVHAEFAGSTCFLEVGSRSDKAALQRLQRQMLRELCDVDVDIISVAQGIAELKKRLHSKRVLLVIDDIWTAAQLDALLVPVKCGSHVIVTTRNAQLLRSSCYPGILSQPVDLLDRQAALQLFSWCAFLAKEPPPNFSQLAAEAVKQCAGLPLTITVLGAYLWEQPGPQWQAALSRLHAAQSFTGCRTQDDKLWGKLKPNYDALGVPEQQMFLDIACCMLGKRASAALPAWGAGAGSTLRNLMDRSLVRIGDNGQLGMHDQLRDMARAIVVMENRGRPALRSRVWGAEALYVDFSKQGMDAVEVLSLRDDGSASYGALEFIGDICSPNNLRLFDMGHVFYRSEGFMWLNRMASAFSGVCIMQCVESMSFKAFSSLVYLEWHSARRCRHLPTSLVVLDFSGSRFWDHYTLRGLCALTGLQHLNLRCCSLGTLPESLGALTALRQLDLSHNYPLAALPECFGRLTGLQQLDLSGNESLAALPESFGALTALQQLKLSHNRAIAALPECFGMLTGLQQLDIVQCVSLTTLPQSFSALTALQEVRVHGCPAWRALTLLAVSRRTLCFDGSDGFS